MHDHDHEHRAAGDRRALAAALALVAGLVALEVAGGLVSGSLALLADAAHMFSDALSLSLALFAAWLAGRPATPERSFGFRRAEILAALANGVALVVLAIWIFVEAARRLAEPPQVAGGWVLAIGLVGLASNAAAAALLRRRASASLNVRAALRHVLADALGSLGVVVSGAVLLATGWRAVDPLVSVAIGLLVLASSWQVLRESVDVLLEAAPPNIDPDEVGRALVGHPGVVEVHDLHIWTITSGFPAVSAHVLVEPGADCHAIRAQLERMLRERFSLAHSTLQVEHRPGLVKLRR